MMTTIRGAGGGGKSGGSGGRVAVEDPDSLQSKQFARVLDLLCEGEIEGLVDGMKSVYLDETPLQAADNSMNFTGVTVEFRPGTQAQTSVPGFEDQESEVAVGVEVKASAPVVRQITNANVTAVRVTAAVGALTYQDTTTGDLHGSTVELAIDVQANGGSYVTQDLQGSEVISGKTRNRYQRAFRIALTGAAPWNIRVRRITADSVAAHIQDKTYWDSFTELTEVKMTYPNSALAGLSVDSSLFNSIPSRAYRVKMLRIKVPSNYNAVTRVYTGVWDGTFQVAYSNNPAWCFYDMVTTARYGLGGYIDPALTDKWALYTIGKYCDELVPDGYGGTEPRFVLNLLLQSRQEAYKVINDLASAFRGMAYWASGIIAVQDAPADPVAIFTAANVIGGNFHREGAGRKARHTVAVVSWNDPNDFYRAKPEYVEDAEGVARFGIRKTEVVAFGCSSQGQANRVGRWILYTEKYEAEVISWDAGLDASYVRPGQIVKVVDPGRSVMRAGGRVRAATSNSVTLDAPVTLTDAATLSLMMPDGTLIDRPVTSGIGTMSVLTFADALPSTDIVQAMWVLGTTNLVPELVRILAISESAPNVYKLVGLEHYPAKFEAVEQNLKLQLPVTSNLTLAPAAVANLAGSEYLYKQGGSVFARLVISFDSSALAAKYRVAYRRAEGNWVVLPVSPSTHVEVNDVVPASYTLKVEAISAAGVPSPAVEAAYTVLGKTAPPSAVTGFTVTKRTTDLLLEWLPIPDLDVAGYEIRVGAAWDSGAVVISDYAGTMHVHTQTTAGNHYYHIRSIDTSGNYSAEVTTTVINLPAPAAVTQFVAIQNGFRVEMRWQENAETDIVGYEIREGATWEGSSLVTMVNASTYNTYAGTAGARVFWIVAIAAPGIYGETPIFASTSIADLPNRNVLFVSDQDALGFPGSKYQLSVDAGYLTLDSGKTYGEYTFGVNLGGVFRARNLLESSLDVVLNDGTTWAGATFQWLSPQASRRWTVAGSLNGVNVSYQISLNQGLDASYVEAFSLNATTTGENGTVAATAVGVTYTVGRFLQGARVTEFTTLDWALAVPSEFNMTAWAIPEDVTDNRIYWKGVTAAGGYLMVGHKAGEGFYLEDHLGNRQVAAFSPAISDRVLIGVVQTAALRKLYVGKLAGTPVFSEVALTPIGALTSVALHQ